MDPVAALVKVTGETVRGKGRKGLERSYQTIKHEGYVQVNRKELSVLVVDS
ncbi:hypothetical protein HYC85_032098 [Camellia sinensis]|uniref:Uncharacterized protein n=1 Tax=Camellia sinensis TaxID=4442 RepID=A0A7J7FSC9_CAMSI|nr:hypothetical protein HYC85_032098 [Camellia sinensis]